MKKFALLAALSLSSFTAFAQEEIIESTEVPQVVGLTSEQKSRLISLVDKLVASSEHMMKAVQEAGSEVCASSGEGANQEVTSPQCPLNGRTTHESDEIREGEMPAGFGDFEYKLVSEELKAVSDVQSISGRYDYRTSASAVLEPVMRLVVKYDVSFKGSLELRSEGEVDFSGDVVVSGAAGEKYEFLSLEFDGEVRFEDFDAEIKVAANAQGVQSATLNGESMGPAALKELNERIQQTRKKLPAVPTTESTK